MKNNSVKFKKTVPRSSTTSVISEFSDEASPVANGFLVPSFNHAHSISARLSRTSQFNEQNMMLTTPVCRWNLRPDQMLQDEVLSKSPMARYKIHTPINIVLEPASFTEALNNNTKFTSQTMKRITRMEELICNAQDEPDQATDSKLFNLEDETPKPSQNRFNHLNGFENQMDIEQEIPQFSEKDTFDLACASKEQIEFTNKYNKLAANLRLFRKSPAYFQTYDGQFMLDRPSNSNYSKYQNQDGIILNNGQWITSIVLVRDTFRLERCCENPEQVNYSAVCVGDTYLNNSIITGSENGRVLVWQNQKSIACSYYTLNDEIVGNVNSKPTYITTERQSIFVGTDDNVL